MTTIITRKQLYDRVWRQPMVHIAREFGVSDVGLRKACQRHGIPTPGAGHWAKVANGKRVTISSLPDPDDDHPIRIWRGSSGEEPDAIAQARADALAAAPAIATTATGHPVVDRTLAKLSTAKPGHDGLLRSRGAKLIAIAVRPQMLPRAEAVLRQLVGTGEAAGLALTPGTDAMAWQSAGETVAFALVEAVDRVAHVATERELAALAKWRREREETHRRFGYWRDWGEPRIPKWEEQYNGRLAVRLEKVRIKSEQNPWGRVMRGTFADSRTRDVMRAIPSVVATVAALAAAKRSNAAYEQRRRAAEEAARRRWEEEERRRICWERAGQVLDELIELDRRAAAIRQWLGRVRGGRPLQARSLQFMALAEEHLAQVEDRLGSAALERRLEAARLFDDSE